MKGKGWEEESHEQGHHLHYQNPVAAAEQELPFLRFVFPSLPARPPSHFHQNEPEPEVYALQPHPPPPPPLPPPLPPSSPLLHPHHSYSEMQ